MNRVMIDVKGLGKDYQIRVPEGNFLKQIFGRKYEKKVAVHSIDFQIDEGEIVGFIGPNGAGKSTTIKMLTGILQPDRGSVTVNCINPGENRIENTRNIGVVFGQRTQLWWDIPLKDTLHLMKYMYRIPEEIYQENLALYSEILGLKEFIDLPVRQLSLGQRMRADIACAILHNPKILYLDEPTIGLDIFVKDAVRKFVREINEQKRTTVLLTTHDMTDIEKLCSRVMVIDKGRIIYTGSLEQLKSKYGYQEIVEAKGNWENDFLHKIALLPSVSVEKMDDKVLIHFDNREIDSDQILLTIMRNKQIRDIRVHEQKLDGIIQQLYREE
uniref:ABC transporter ATP-binding protein n=1 Tax=Acetatifactor sp. TaxID=1872090 RepID=UPI00405665C4